MLAPKAWDAFFVAVLGAGAVGLLVWMLASQFDIDERNRAMRQVTAPSVPHGGRCK